MRPAVTIPTRYEIDAIVTKRRRLEVSQNFRVKKSGCDRKMTHDFKTLHPYERKLIEIPNSYDLPPPPPEFLRLIRDRAELKAKCLLFQADQNKQLHLLSTDQDRVHF